MSWKFTLLVFGATSNQRRKITKNIPTLRVGFKIAINRSKAIDNDWIDRKLVVPVCRLQ